MIETILAKQLVKVLLDHQMTIATAESCTGGLVAATLINCPGASGVINESYITYSNEAKHRILGVEKEILGSHGAVSPEKVAAMAEGVAKVAGADVGLATSGIAGPDGGSKEKPVGLVYIGYYCQGKVWVEENHFKGNRNEVREQTVIKALSSIYRHLK